MEFKHKPVLLNECIEGLKIKPDGIYVDGTLGGAGHSKEIAKRLDSKKGLLIGIDRDEEALMAAKENLKDYPKVFFHVDMTQSIGKYKIDLENVDLASASAHKIFGIKGIGLLIKKEKILLEPLIHGGKSTTVYRSGTPAVALIVSLAKALRLINENMEEHYNYVSKLNKKLRDELASIPNVYINSNQYCSPYVLNISAVGVKPETMLHALEAHDIYISTQTACASNISSSKAVEELTGSMERATSSLRISMAYITTEEEIDTFLKVFKKCFMKLSSLR